jgi:multiple sugar transport system permease protein
MATAAARAFAVDAGWRGALRRLADSERWLGAALIAPAVLYIGALVGLPFFLAIFYSLSDITVGSSAADLVGLRNYRAVMHSPSFWVALENTLIFALVSQALVLVLAKILAMLLLKDFRGRWLVRLLIILPWVAPISLGAIGWLWILDSIYSVVNWTARAAGIFGPGTWPIYLGDPELAMGSIIVVHVWRTLPLATIIILAGLSSIPQDINDAAEIDGAGFWRKLFQITLPLVMPIMLVALLFGLVFTVVDMIVVYVLTRGGPFDSTQVLASLAYFTGIDGGDLAEGAAIALFLFPVLVAVAILFLQIARRAEVT